MFNYKIRHLNMILYMTIVILFDSYPFILIFDFNRRSLNEILVENEE